MHITKQITNSVSIRPTFPSDTG